MILVSYKKTLSFVSIFDKDGLQISHPQTILQTNLYQYLYWVTNRVAPSIAVSYKTSHGGLNLWTSVNRANKAYWGVTSSWNNHKEV